MNSLNRVVIFGATSAIAEHTARLLIEQGASICCVGRNPDKLSALVNDFQVRADSSQIVTSITADLTQTADHAQLIEKAASELGGLDAALIAHGCLPDQARCEHDFRLIEHQLQINGISVLSLLTLLANYFEDQGRGVITAISSVAGDRGRKSNYVYGTAKGMVSIYMQGMRNRLADKGVDVITIKPGFVDTPMTAEFEKSGILWATPDTIAKGIVQAMSKGKNEAYLPGFWRLIMFIIRHIPESIFKRLSL